LGTIGDVGAMSLMAGKAFAIGEAGILITDDERIYQRAVAFGHYERFDERVDDAELAPFRGLPLGGYKYRMHQLSSAVGRVQLRHYDEQIAEIDAAMGYFWDSLAGVGGLRAVRPDASVGNRAGGWYGAHGLYEADELGGLSVTRFCQALRAEGVAAKPGVNRPLHLHPLLNTADVYHAGTPTRIAHSDRDLRQGPGSLPVSEAAGARTYSIPWFKHDDRAVIDEYVAAFVKVSANYKELLADDPGDPADVGGWHFFNAGGGVS
jgi:dTDP-4-amino-4,6-dideoxygalactose transaminase